VLGVAHTRNSRQPEDALRRSVLAEPDARRPSHGPSATDGRIDYVPAPPDARRFCRTCPALDAHAVRATGAQRRRPARRTGVLCASRTPVSGRSGALIENKGLDRCTWRLPRRNRGSRRGGSRQGHAVVGHLGHMPAVPDAGSLPHAAGRWTHTRFASSGSRRPREGQACSAPRAPRIAPCAATLLYQRCRSTWFAARNQLLSAHAVRGIGPRRRRPARALRVAGTRNLGSPAAITRFV